MAMAETPVSRAIVQERLRRYREGGPTSSSASALLAFALVVLIWKPALAQRLLVGIAALVCALTFRLALGRASAREWAPEAALKRFRIAAALHGLSWGLLAALVLPVVERPGFELLLYGQTALCAGALLTTGFDIVGAIAFAAPAGLPLALTLTGRAESQAPDWILIAGALITLSVAAALRARIALIDAVSARLAESDRVEAADAAGRELAQKRHLLELLMQTSQNGFWFIDDRGKTMDLNPAMCRLLGRPREAVLGREAVEFFDGTDLETLRREIARRAQGHAGSYEITITRPDGSRIHCSNHATPIIDAAGRPAGSVGIWADISERRHHEAVLGTYETVVNSLVDLVSVVDEQRTYLMVNDAWCRSFGRTREAAIGRTASEIMPWAMSEERDAAFRACLTERAPRSILTATEDPGRPTRWFETTYHPYIDAAQTGRRVVIVTRNVTEQEQARREIQIGAEYLRRTLNATGDAIFAADSNSMDAPVRFVNDQMLQMWRIPPERGPSLTSTDIMTAASALFKDPKAEAARIRAIITTGSVDQTRLELRDGRVLLRRCIPAQVGNHRVRVWSFRDITTEEQALQQARASEAAQRALLDAFPGYIAAVDRHLRYTYVNSKVAALRGGQPPDFIGRHAQEVLGDRDFEIIEAEVRRARLGQQPVVEMHHPAHDGRPRIDIELTHVAGPVGPDGEQVCYAFGVDITTRKIAEEALVGARDEAEQASRSKTRFLAQMSHELRTPLNAIMGLGQLLASDMRRPLAAAHKAFVDEMMRGARHLLDLINEVLDLSSVESGQIPLANTDIELRGLLDECLGLVRPLAAGHEIGLPADGSVADGWRVFADRLRLKQVLLNLLGNAIKYNQRSGAVTLELMPEGEFLCLGIRDTGPGLTAAECARLFQPFERLGAAQAGVEGTGIGLALSRRLVEAMGGAIGVESEPGVGSLFWLRLQRAHGPAESPVPQLARDRKDAAQPRLTGEPKVVLYIEDNPVNVFVMEALFERFGGVRLVSASTGLAGLQMARSLRPSLILLDQQLPEMNGTDVLAQLRSHEETARLPVIAVSANAMPGQIDAAIAAGALAYVTKPIDINTLLAALQHALGASHVWFTDEAQ